jgi:hypothetical protein
MSTRLTSIASVGMSVRTPGRRCERRRLLQRPGTPQTSAAIRLALVPNRPGPPATRPKGNRSLVGICAIQSA